MMNMFMKMKTVLCLSLLTACGGSGAGVIYPDTDQAPQLDFIWDDENIQQEIQNIGEYGGWEGAPNVEGELIFEYEDSQPIYAYAPGTVTHIHDNTQITLRYGENYAVTYFHLMQIPDHLETGKKIEKGTLLGYTETLQDDGSEGLEFWEIAVMEKDDEGLVWYLPPMQFFDEESLETLDSLREEIDIDSWVMSADDTPGESEGEKGESFVDELGTRLPADDNKFGSGSRMSHEDFLAQREKETGADLQWLSDIKW